MISRYIPSTNAHKLVDGRYKYPAAQVSSDSCTMLRLRVGIIRVLSEDRRGSLKILLVFVSISTIVSDVMYALYDTRIVAKNVESGQG